MVFPGAAGTVTVWITALYHEPFYYSVESETVIESFFCKGYIKLSTVSGAYSGYSSRIHFTPVFHFNLHFWMLDTVL